MDNWDAFERGARIVFWLSAVYAMSNVGSAIGTIAHSLKSIAEDVRANTYRKP